MKRSIPFLVVTIALLASVTACAPGSSSGTTAGPAKQVPPITTPTPTVAPAEPTVVISISGPRYGSPLFVEVLKGDYKLSSGTTAREGSTMGLSVKDLTFPTGLEIDVQHDVTLRGKTYSKGTKLIVDAQGDLVPQ